MIAELTSSKIVDSRYGGRVFLLTFRDEDGTSYQTWVDPANRNFANWEEVVKMEAGTKLDNLTVKKGRLINADCRPKII